MQTFIFSVFNLDLDQKIKFSLCFEVRNESRKEFLISFLGEGLSVTLPLQGLLGVQPAHNQLAKGLWTGREDQAQSTGLLSKRSVSCMIFWSVYCIASRCED